MIVFLTSPGAQERAASGTVPEFEARPEGGGVPWVIESDGRGGYAYATPPSVRLPLGVTVDGVPNLSGPLGAVPGGVLCAPAVDGGAPRVLVAGFEEELFVGVVPWERLGVPGGQPWGEQASDPSGVPADPASVASAEDTAAGIRAAPVVVRELLQPHGRHATLVRWRLASGDAATLRVRPLLPSSDQLSPERAEAPQSAHREPRCSAVEVGGAVLVRESAATPAVRFGGDDGVDFRSAPHWVEGRTGASAGGGGLDTSTRFLAPGALRVELRADDARRASFTLELAVAGHGRRAPGAAFEYELGRRQRRDLEARPGGASAKVADWAVRLAALTERCVHRTDQGRPVVGCPWSEHAAARALTGAELWGLLPGFIGAASELCPGRALPTFAGQDAVWRSLRWLVVAELEAFEFSEGPGSEAAVPASVVESELRFAWCLGELARLGHLRSDPALAARCADVRTTIARRLVDRWIGSGERATSGAPRAQLHGGAAYASAADICGSIAAGGDTSRAWARARRTFVLGFRAGVLSGDVQRAQLLRAAGLPFGPLGTRARRAVLGVYAEEVDVYAEDVGGPDVSDLDALELADVVRAALYTLPRTRAAVAAWRALWLRSLEAAPRTRLYDPRQIAAWRAIDLDLTHGDPR